MLRDVRTNFFSVDELTMSLSAAEERRQRILANSQARLEKLREVTRSEQPQDVPPMAPISSPAPASLLTKRNDEPTPAPRVENDPSLISSLFSSVTSLTNMVNSFTSAAASKNKTTTTPEATRDILLVDKQHILLIILGILVSLLYAFYISSQSNLFFAVYFTSCIGILTSRYYFMQMKHRTNIFITTAMLSGFRPELMKTLLLVYTLVCDAWVIFSFYFVSFCLTHVICALI